MFVLLITGIYSGILGSNILLKEESDKTIEYLNSVPVTRKKIVVTKIACAISYIILMVITLGIFNFIGLSLSGDFNRKSYILLSVTPIFSSIVIFALCLFLISVFTLADIRNVIVDVSINHLMVVLAIILTIMFMLLTIIHYNRKELV